MRIRHLFMRIIIALLISQAFYYIVDSFTVKRWNSSESLIVRIVEAGPELAVESESEDAYAMLERDTVLQVLSGNEADRQMTVKTVRLLGSGHDVKPGEFPHVDHDSTA